LRREPTAAKVAKLKSFDATWEGVCGMSVAVVQPSHNLPDPITLDDLAALAEGDESHRYELSGEGVLQVMSPPSFAHQQISTEVILWLAAHGYSATQIVAAPGVHTETDDVSGGRQLDITLWPADYEPRHEHGVYVSPVGMIAAIEIVSPSSRTIDKIEKRREYAAAGIPTYVIVDCDASHTVTVLQLADGAYEVTTRVTLRRLLSAFDPKEVFGA
jgi:Uma2 family endonuclease